MKNFTFISNLHLVCGKEKLRPSLQCVHFKNGYAYASDAHVLIKQPLSLSNIQEPENLEGKAIHSSIFKEIRKMKHVVCTPDGFECRTKDNQKVFYQYSETNTPPDFEAVIPKDKLGGVAEIGIKPAFVTLLGKAMAGGSCGLKAAFRGERGAIVFEPIQQEYNGEIGLFMPTLLYSYPGL